MGKLFKNKILLIMAGLAAIAGLFVALKPDSSESEQNSSQQQAQSSTQSPMTKTFTLKVGKDQISGDTEMKVTDGDTVLIVIDSEIADEFHMHGYDVSVDLKPGGQQQVKFDANQTGRFEIELHELDQEIAVLEVQPRP